MSEIKNKIITISGEPVSGKSTVVKALKRIYEQKGFNVHIISVGQLFRDAIKEEYVKMYPDKKDANLADIQADESFAEIRNRIDKMIDKEIVKRKGEEINSKERPSDIYIIDSRLAWQNIPDSFSVRLTVDEKIAGRRVYNDKSRGTEDAYKSVEDATEKTKQRKLGEINRYIKRYNVDLRNPENYNLIIDTSYSNTEELAEIIINGEESYRERKNYPKYWTSPVHFLPSGLKTLYLKMKDFGFAKKLLSKRHKKTFNNITAEDTVEMIEKDDKRLLKKGFYIKVYRKLLSGRTLIPYIVIKNVDKPVGKPEQGIRDELTNYQDGTRERQLINTPVKNDKSIGR